MTGYVALPVAIALFLLLALTKQHSNILGFHRLPVWGLPAMIIVLCVFIAGLFIHSPRPLVMLGNISFSLYLIHYYPVMFLDRKVFNFTTASPFTIFGAILSVTLCILLAYVCWYLVENRFTKWLRRRLRV